MSEKSNFKRSFKRSAIISAVTTFIAYMIISRVQWGLLGSEFSGGKKPDAAVNEAARIAAVTDTVTIGGRIWMKKNLNVWIGGSWCYEDNLDNCAEYGRLYTWRVAKKACASLGDGWRLPTEYDWDALIDAVGGTSIAGAKLKSQTGWRHIGTDDFGFSALPGGYMLTYVRSTPHFYHIGNRGKWWSAAESGGRADRKDISGDEIESYVSDKTQGCSVRCVRDKERRK